MIHAITSTHVSIICRLQLQPYKQPTRQPINFHLLVRGSTDTNDKPSYTRTRHLTNLWFNNSSNQTSRQPIHLLDKGWKNSEGRQRNQDHMNDIPASLSSGCVACCCWWFGKSGSLGWFRSHMLTLSWHNLCVWVIPLPSLCYRSDWLTERTHSKVNRIIHLKDIWRTTLTYPHNLIILQALSGSHGAAGVLMLLLTPSRCHHRPDPSETLDPGITLSYCCCITDGDSLSACTSMCMGVHTHTHTRVWLHGCIQVCVSLPVLSVSISVSSTTVFPVFNFINIPSSSGCNLKSHD